LTWSIRALGWAMWRLLRGRGRVCLPWTRSSPSPWVVRGGDRRLRPGLSLSPGVERSGVRRLPGLSPSLSPRVGRIGVRRLQGLSPSPSPEVGRIGVRRLSGLSPSPSPGSGGAEFPMVPEAGPDCLSASLCRVAQQSERRRRRCPSVRPVSGAAKWLRSPRLCRLEDVRQDKGVRPPLH
jgi:hypothetical protein